MSSDLNSQIFLLEVNHPIYPDFQLNFNYYNQFAMTLLVSWIAVDSRAPSSIYVASDSKDLRRVVQQTMIFGKKSVRV